MKLAYKISIPLVALVSALILFVAINAGNTQKEIIKKGQDEQAKKVLTLFEENKKRRLDVQKKDIEFVANMASEISVTYLYDFDFDALNKPLSQLLSYDEIKAIHVYEANKKEPIIRLGQTQEAYKKILKDVIWKETKEELGHVEVYYDDRDIIAYFNKAGDDLLAQLQQSNQRQNRFIDKITQNQIIMDLTITFLILIALLMMVYKMVTKPLKKLERGLDSFFMFLQGKADKTHKIDIKSSDEFGKMCTSINENIQVSAQLHEEIKELNSNLEAKIAKRTKQVRQLLDNAAEGFLSFNKKLIIDKEYSKECENIFGEPIGGKKITDFMHKNIHEEEKKLFIKMVADIFNPDIHERKKEVFLRLFPQEYIINDKTIKVAYKNLENKKIMLILTDMTEKKLLEEKIAMEKKRLKMVVSVVSNLNEFYEMTEEFLSFAKGQDVFLDTDNQLLNMVTLYYRKIHTFKGNFAQKDMVYIVPKLHEYESKINEIVKNPNRTYEDFKALLENANLSSWIDEDMQVLNDILDEKLLNNRESICVSKPILDMVENKLKELLEHPKHERNVTYEEILDDICNIKKRSFIEHISSYIKYVDQLASRLGKQLYPMQILGDDCQVNDDIKPFIKSLTHIFRNSVDHGIEAQEVRMESSKDDWGTISCQLQTTDKNLILQIVDDGMGIDINKLKEKALSLNLYNQKQLDKMSENEILQMIFLDSFSTKDEVSDLSGRGVGLSAVKHELERLNGHIDIKTKLHKGTTFIFTIPLGSIN